MENLPGTETKMLLIEISKALGIDARTVRKYVAKLFPGLMKNGIATYLNEEQATKLKLEIQRNQHLERSFQVPKTALEKELLIQQAMQFQAEKIEALQEQLNSQSAALSAAQPKIEYHDATVQSPDLQSVAEFSNTLNKRNIKIGEKRLFKWFYENKYLIYHNRPYQSALNAGYFEVAQIEGTDYRNRPLMYNKVFITGKGRVYFTKRIVADLCPPVTDNVQIEVEA